MQKVRSFVGMDVHKETISISVAEDGRNGPVRFLGVIPNATDDVAKMANRAAGHGDPREPLVAGDLVSDARAKSEASLRRHTFVR